MQIATNTSNHGLDADQVWDTDSAYEHLSTQGLAETRRTAERRLHEWQILPAAIGEDSLQDERGRPANRVLLSWAMEQARAKRARILFLQLHALPSGQPCLHAIDPRGARLWLPLERTTDGVQGPQVELALQRLQQHIGKTIAVFPHAELVGLMRDMALGDEIRFTPSVYPPVMQLKVATSSHGAVTPHLKALEDESIHIIREAVAESENPVMMYSLGKDSCVMLHLARKAFYPAPPPFPLMHVDTRWKFQEMYQFRDHMVDVSGMDLLVHINPEAIEKDINPFDHGSALHTDITKTEGLKQALDKYRFDVIFGGARRDEEKSRAKERIFSFRTATHRWDPKKQRPELWHLYNTKKSPGESIRVFPLSNWTEMDIWQYILQEDIPVVPLYFAKKRPVVSRNGMLMMVDDDRFRLLPGETIEEKLVRFRTLGCYPLTGAVESSAATLPEIILELVNARSSERQGRAIDTDSSGSMEKKKQEGYF